MRNCTSSGTVEQGPPLPANRNDGFLSGENVRPLVEMVDDRIRALFSGGQDPDILYEAARHLLLAGGKRIRSLLTLMSCQAVGGAPEEALPLAVALELVQTASIIHDDIIDGDTQRRGVEATHVRFGTKMAILAGDLLVGLALREIARLSKPLILRELGEIGIAMCEGEIRDPDLTIDR
ncbi:MAG: polyprenyl synthetase family protein, partial [Candidatus Thorarchaeota archaeon]